MAYKDVVCQFCEVKFTQRVKTANQSFREGHKPTCKNCFGKWPKRYKTPVQFNLDSNGCHNCISHKLNDSGYPANGEGPLHRVLYQKKFGKLETSVVVRHKCDNRLCINLDHLITGSHADNVADRVARGRSAKGETNGRAKLNWEKADMIRESSLSNSELAVLYVVDPKVIRNIKNGISWVR